MKAGLRQKDEGRRMKRKAAKKEPARCFVCGCTLDCECPGGCAWLKQKGLRRPLCSRCSFTLRRSRAYQRRLKLSKLESAFFAAGIMAALQITRKYHHD